MMIKDLSFKFLDVLNKVNIDKYGRVSAFLAINKPKGITSHDVVDQVRKKLGTRKVGHVGALDPNASGVLLILVGKQYTRLSEDLMLLDKAYKMRILFGVETDSYDVEGKIVDVKKIDTVDEKKIIEILQNYEGGYKQVVPVFSSVKVDGKKLRVLARSYEGYSISTEGEEVRVLFSNSNGQQYKVTLPKRDILINNIKLLKLGLIEKEEISKYFQNLENITVLPYVEIQFDCSKGTYVRQFAHDLGLEYKYPAVLAELERTRIGSISIDQCITIDELQSIN